MARPCRDHTGFFSRIVRFPGRGETIPASTPSEAKLATRLYLLRSGATASGRTAAFPDSDEPLDAGGRAKATRRPPSLPAHATLFTSPWASARETATLLGLHPATEPLLADIDRGAWAGRTLAEVHASAEGALARWFADPASATPGGETLDEVVARIARWMDRVSAIDCAVVAVTHVAVVRAAIAHALRIPAAATLAIDIAPLSRTILSFNRQWRVQGLTA